MSDKMKGIFLAMTAAFAWGIMGIFSRSLSDAGFGSIEISFLRCAIAGSLYLLFIGITNPKVLKINFKGLIICLLYGILAYGISFISFSFSVSRVPVAVATVLMFMSPIWVTLISVLVFKESIQTRKILSIITCIIGAVLTANLLGTSASGGLDPLGLLAGVVNGVGVALQIMVPRFFTKEYEKDTMLVYGFLGAALFLGIFTDFGVFPMAMETVGISSLLLNSLGVGALCTMVANVAFVKSTNFIDPTTTSIISAIEVITGAFVGVLVYQEILSPLQMVGAVIIVLGAMGAEGFGSRKLK